MAIDDEASDLPGDELTERERDALHRMELGLESLQRAHGLLVGFHHATGHGMDHLAEAESLFRAAGHEHLADVLRDDLLPRGVIDGDRWSYDVLEGFQEEFLDSVETFEEQCRDEVAGGDRHLNERRMEARWKHRSRSDDR